MALYTIKLRRGIASDWTAINPVLDEGEFGYELDTRNFKIGDGSLHWNDLEYVIDENDRLPDASLLDDGKILLTDGGQWILTDLSSVTGIPLSAKGDLLTYSTAESTTTVIISNPNAFTLVSTAGTADEVLVPGAVVDLDDVGDEVLVTGTFTWSQDDPGNLKAVIVRVRRDNLAGEQLAISVDPGTIDSIAGNDASWTISITDSAPTTGKYVITVQPQSGKSISTIYSATHLLEADTDVVVSAGLVAVPVSGVNGRILTEDDTVDEGISWQDAGSGLPDATGEADGRVLVVLDDEWVIGDASGGGGKTFFGTIEGPLVAGSVGTARMYNDTGGPLTILSSRASITPAGTAFTVDVNKNGTTIYTTQANRPAVAAGGTTNKTVPDVTTIADGEYFTVDLDLQSGSTAFDVVTVQIEAIA